MNKRPPFITFEGGEGAGKTSQIRLLKTWLEEQGKTVTTTREPGGTPGAEAIRDLIVQGHEGRWDRETDTLLFMAARRDNLSKVIWPALDRGDWVLSDRFVDSTYAYQSYGRGLDLNSVKRVYDFVGGDFLPDVTFIMDIDPRAGLDRVLQGKSDRNLVENRYENFDFSFHEKLRAGYLDMAKHEPKRFVVLKLEPEQSIDDVQSILRQHIQQRFL